MITDYSMHPDEETVIEAASIDDLVIFLTIGRSVYTRGATIFLPDDDRTALRILDALEAAVDNAASKVRLREQKRAQADTAAEGAGASVEAYRG